MVHILYKFFACKQNLPANLKAMPASKASRAAIYLLIWPRKKQLVATTGHLTHSIKYELYGPLKINKETLQVKNMTERTVSQETNETTIMFSCG